MDINSLSLREKIGQKFIIGINSNNIESVIKMIKEYHIGGVILYRKNYSNYEDMINVIRSLKTANKENKVPLFIAIDQENGIVNRLPSEFKRIKNNYDLASISKDLVYDSAKLTSNILKDIGINMNFAPVLDICTPDNKYLSKRCFGSTKEAVYENSRVYIKGLEENNIISVVKHFPGHGLTTKDSHLIIPYVNKNSEEVENHLYPFKMAIKEGINGIMLSHLVIRGYTKLVPSSVSKDLINNYLRDKCNYNGLIITDEMNMILKNPLYKHLYYKLFTSGSDIILLKLRHNERKIIDKYIDFITNNKDYRSELDESVNRILDIKSRYNVNDSIDNIGCNIENINIEIDKINEKVISN